MTQERIMAYAKKQGYAGADYLGQWRGYDVFDPYFSEEDRKGLVELDVGYPLRILVKGNAIRMTTPEESLDIPDKLPGKSKIDSIEEV